METSARIVIIGAGIVGCSIAYHLVRAGWRDLIVLDKGPLYETGGSTSHAPGLMYQLNNSRFLTQCAAYTADLVHDLTYTDTQCAYQVGGIELAVSKERHQELLRRHALAQAYGIESYLITGAEAKQYIPILDPATIQSAFFTPADTDVRGWYAAAALAEKAIAAGGAQFYGDTEVTDLLIRDNRIVGVRTEAGDIATDQVVLATNVWANVLGARIGIHFPIAGAQHQYVITESVPSLKEDKDTFIKHPMLRYQDYSIYYRQHGDAYGIGNYGHQTMLVEPGSIATKAEGSFTPKDFIHAEHATWKILPELQGLAYSRAFNGYMPFTCDGMPLMGDTTIFGLHACLGVWVTHAGGVGKTMAEWLTSKTTEFAWHEADLRRLQPHAASPHWRGARIDRQYQEVYKIIHPLDPPTKPRNIRHSPFHDRLVALGAQCLPAADWEIAEWYDCNADLLEKYSDRIPRRSGWEGKNWSPIEGAEHLAIRDGVGMYDLSNFAVFEVHGADALKFLEYLAVNRIDRPIGTVIYTALCDAVGGIRADVTITRVAASRFRILTGGGSGLADLYWLQLHATEYNALVIEDKSSAYAGIGLWGPQARKVLQKTTTTDLSNQSFPYFTARDLYVSSIPVWAARLSYAGELGWEIYCPTEYALALWDLLWDAGKPEGIFPLGHGALRSLRYEKGYRAVGAELTTDYTPYEAGIGWAVQLKKGSFLGSEALRLASQGTLTRSLCCLTFADPAAVMLAKEPVYTENSTSLGYITGGDYGYSVGKYIAYAYLPYEYTAKGTPIEVQYFDRRYKGQVAADPQFDPRMERIKS